jgi:ATP-dependent exoDNAse (exonuclease V) beta subunit
MPLDDAALHRWEKLLSEVTATEVPLECIKKVLIKLRGGRQRTFNIHTLRRQGLDFDEIESALIRTLNEYGDQVRDLDYVIDAATVAEMLQPKTDELLQKLS